MEVLGLLVALAAWFFIWRFIAKKLIAVFKAKEQNTTQNKIKAHIVGAAVGFVACIIIFAIIVPKDTVETTTDKKHFSCTVEQFLDNYNHALTNLESQILVSAGEEKDNGERLTIKLNSNKNIALVVTADKKSRHIESLIFIGASDGTFQSGVDIVFGALAVVMAFENPDMTKSQRGKVIADLGLSNGKLSEQGEVKFERNNVQYTINRSDVAGTMLAAWPIASVTETEPTVTAESAPMTRDQAKAFAQTYLDAIYDAQQIITDSENNPEIIKKQYKRLAKMIGQWPAEKDQPAARAFNECFIATIGYSILLDTEKTSEQIESFTEEFKTDLVACEASLQAAAPPPKTACRKFVSKAKEELMLYYINADIYYPVDCDVEKVNGEYYLFCTQTTGSGEIGGLYLIRCDDDNYKLYTVNGKAMQHAEAHGLNAERLKEYRDISAILDEF